MRHRYWPCAAADEAQGWGAQCILPQAKYLERKKRQVKSVLVLERTSKRQAYHTVLLAWSQHNPSNGSHSITSLQTEPGVQWQPTHCGCLDAKQQQNRSLLWSLPQLSYPAQHGSPSYCTLTDLLSRQLSSCNCQPVVCMRLHLS